MISVPGKVFVIGEYSVMNGGAAVLASLKPEFQCGWNNANKIHPDCPAGKFLSQNKTAAYLKVEGGLGPGFGSSAAELISANDYIDKPWTEEQLWQWYRENFSPASGADLVIQSLSRKTGCGFYRFQIDQKSYRTESITIPDELSSCWFLFHAPSTRKIPTYLDLENNKAPTYDPRKADALVQRWIETFDPAILTEWCWILKDAGLESMFGTEVRSAFQSVPGVAGVKGCGAGLNDVFIVCLKKDSPEIRSALNAIAEKFDLRPLGSLRDHV